MMKRYLVGSNLLCLHNCCDHDYVVVVETDEEYRKCVFEEENHIYYISKPMLDKYMNFEIDYKENVHDYLIQYQLDQNIISWDFPYKYNILDHKDKYIELLKYVVENKKHGFRRLSKKDNECCTKGLYHIAYNMFICLNNSTILTKEQKEIIQQIHDRKMPISYLDEMEKIINSL